MHKLVQSVVGRGAPRRGSVKLPALESGQRLGDALAVARHPGTDRVEPFDLFGRYGAVGHRRDVEQQVAALGGDLLQAY